MGGVDAASAPGGTIDEGEPNVAIGVLEFRVAPRKPGSDLGPSPLTNQEIAQGRKNLAENGPRTSIEWDDEFVWMKIMPGVELPKYNPHQIAGEYQGAEYLLVYNWPPSVMSSEMDWGLQSVTEDAKDAMGRPAVGFQFNQEGGDRFYDLTSANIDQAPAIIIEGEVVSAPHIAMAIRSQGMITGSFAAEQIDDMVKALQGIVRPVSTTAVPVTRRAARIYLIPVVIFVLVVSMVGFLVYR